MNNVNITMIHHEYISFSGKLGLNSQDIDGSSSSKVIRLHVDDTLEGYSLQIKASEELIILKGNNPAQVFWGIQTILSLQVCKFIMNHNKLQYYFNLIFLIKIGMLQGHIRNRPKFIQFDIILKRVSETHHNL